MADAVNCMGFYYARLMKLHKHIGYLRVDMIPGYNLYSEQDRPRKALTLPQLVSRKGAPLKAGQALLRTGCNFAHSE